MLYSLREEKEGKLQMLLSLRKNGLTSLFKEVRVFKEIPLSDFCLSVSSAQHVNFISLQNAENGDPKAPKSGWPGHFLGDCKRGCKKPQ